MGIKGHGELGKPPRVYDRTSDLCLGTVVRISDGSIVLLSDQPHPLTSTFRCRIAMPEQMLFTSELTFDARSIWTQKGVETGTYLTGFQLTNITPEEHETIELYLRESLPRI